MKVAVFSESYLPYISGVTRSVQLLKKELEVLGHDVFLFVPDYPGYKDTEKNVVRFPSIPTRYPGFRMAVPLPGMIPKIDFDIIHSNSPFLLGLVSQVYAKTKKIPYVYTFHTLFTEYLHNVPLPKKMALPVLSFLIKSFCNRCDRIIVPNEMTKAYLSGFNVRCGMEAVPSGVDIGLCEKASASGIRKKFGIPPVSPILFFAGRLSKEKNVPFLLKMFSLVLKERPDVYFVLAADGPLRKELEAMSGDLGIVKNVVFAGQIPYPEVLNYYKAADVFVFSSKTETQGLVIAEAKACGLPVVAVNARGIKESVTDGIDGFLTDESAGDFSKKVLMLLDNASFRLEMAGKAKENAARGFSSKIIAKKTEMVYNSLR